MLQPFQQFISKQHLIQRKGIVLLAVSGGIDSVVMAELFHQSGFHFAIAHCNFKLRKNESEQDQDFVKKLAAYYQVPFHCTSFDTAKYATKEGISLQMAARQLRYTWFEQIRKKENYSSIAVAHHQNDEAETILINLTRGTGISGLHGILPRQEKIIRPLLFTSRSQIEDFAKENKLAYREDSSNTSLKYIRNKIRLQIIPVLKEINPDFENSIGKSVERIRNVEQIFRKEIEKARSKLVISQNNQVRISIAALKKWEPINTYLYELLKEFQFNSTTVDEVLDALDGIPGKKFFSPTHRLLKDRSELIITKNKEEKDTEYFIEQHQELTCFPLNIKTALLQKSNKLSIPTSPNIAWLDYQELKFPLKIRRWRKGDVFIPFGMTGQKKLSDFFIDQKLSLAEKENTWLLISDDKIAWVIGQRIDQRFGISEKTECIYIVHLSDYSNFE